MKHIAITVLCGVGAFAAVEDVPEAIVQIANDLTVKDTFNDEELCAGCKHAVALLKDEAVHKNVVTKSEILCLTSVGPTACSRAIDEIRRSQAENELESDILAFGADAICSDVGFCADIDVEAALLEAHVQLVSKAASKSLRGMINDHIHLTGKERSAAIAHLGSAKCQGCAAAAAAAAAAPAPSLDAFGLQLLKTAVTAPIEPSK